MTVATDRVPLSFNQEFLCLFDKGEEEGPFGPAYNIVCGWRLTGAVDLTALRGALDDLVVRHEALRTEIVRQEGDRHQRVLPPAPVRLAVRDLDAPPEARDRRAEELLIELEGGRYGIGELPLVRAVLGRFDDRDAVLALIAHHSAVDEWSMKLMIRDLAALYARRRGFDVPLEPARQYREYARWDRDRAAEPAMERSRAYWRERLGGAVVVPTRTDHRRSDDLPKCTAAYRFVIDAELTSAALRAAARTRSSAFMVLMAAYKVFLHETTGATDVTVTTFSSGRGQARFQDTVGSFFNLLPIRTDLSGCGTFGEVIARVRGSALQAYRHDIPFGQIVEQVPEITASFAGDDTCVVSFQVFQFPFTMERSRIGDLVYDDLRRRVLSQPVTTDIPDGALWTLDLDPAGDLVCSLWFNTNLFEEATIRDMVSRFLGVLGKILPDPDAPLTVREKGDQ
ncbi:MAG TPA: condensation domain-containing protein [Nonomuraea sp.]|nr:condensation domain-containing protein [Nonomuraea sp.]